jgi:hypothetical protein
VTSSTAEALAHLIPRGIQYGARPATHKHYAQTNLNRDADGTNRIRCERQRDVAELKYSEDSGQTVPDRSQYIVKR